MFSSLNLKEMPTNASSLFSAYASFAAFMMLVRTAANELVNLVPDRVRAYIESVLLRLFTPLSASHDLTLVIDENAGMTRNEVYEAADVYLQTKIGPSNERLRVSKTPRQKIISLAIEKGQEVIDTFDNIVLKWRYVCIESDNNSSRDQKRQFELIFHKRHKDKVVLSYLPYMLDRANAIKEQDTVVKIYTRHSYSYYSDDDDGDWGSISLEHPATFETMAMDPGLKMMIKNDLDRFVRRREFYKKVGKAWKRGYLLYGPPGTGKSSLIAAMANYLHFNIYDLELSSINGDSELKEILLSTKNRSILTIEDIDSSIDVENRESEEEKQQSSKTKLTLSGLLNFIDGLWSSCGDERIIVFTTNHKDRLDPALLRPGRMDVHIHLSYCTASGFKVLASNYLGIGDENPHRLCGEIEGLIESAEVTPAEVAEKLMTSEDADVVLKGLVDFLKCKKAERQRKKEEESNQIKDREAAMQKTDGADHVDDDGEGIVGFENSESDVMACLT
ncbi:hypothetical protein ACFX1T_027034 [Malus domestica]